MMEWSYLYLAVPPAIAVGAAVVASRVTRRSASRIDRMQAQYDYEERERELVRRQIEGMMGDVQAARERHGGFAGATTTATGAAYAGGSEVVHIGPKDGTRHG